MLLLLIIFCAWLVVAAAAVLLCVAARRADAELLGDRSAVIELQPAASASRLRDSVA